MQHIFILLWAAALLGLCQAGHVQVLTSRNFAKVNEGDWCKSNYKSSEAPLPPVFILLPPPFALSSTPQC